MGEIPAIFGTYNTTKTNSKKSKNPAKNIIRIYLDKKLNLVIINKIISFFIKLIVIQNI